MSFISKISQFSQSYYEKTKQFTGPPSIQKIVLAAALSASLGLTSLPLKAALASFSLGAVFLSSGIQKYREFEREIRQIDPFEISLFPQQTAPPINRIDDLPAEVLAYLLSVAGDPCLSSVNKSFKEANEESQILLWQSSIDSFRQDPFINAELLRLNLNFPQEVGAQKKLYSSMLDAYKRLNPDQADRFDSEHRKSLLNPKTYLELSKKMQDASLQNAWSRIHGILTNLDVQDLAPVDASPEIIRAWFDQADPNILGQVTRLELDRLFLTHIPEEIKRFPNLRIFSIFSNQISYLPKDIFQGLPNLEIISLSHNDIQYLPEDVFKNLPRLRELHLLFNKISHIPNQVFNNLSQLEILSLDEDIANLSEFQGHLISAYNSGKMQMEGISQRESLKSAIRKVAKTATVILAAAAAYYGASYLSLTTTCYKITEPYLDTIKHSYFYGLVNFEYPVLSYKEVETCYPTPLGEAVLSYVKELGANLASKWMGSSSLG